MQSEKSSTRRRLRGSYLISLLSIMLVLFVLSLFSSLLLFANNISGYIRENIGFEIIMKKNASVNDIVNFQNQLNEKEYVKSTTFISQEEATLRLSEDLGEDVLEWLGDVENPILPSIDVRFTAEYANNDSIEVIKKWVLKNKNVQDVNYQKVMIENIDNNINNVATVLFIIGIVLLIMSITLICHTVRLSAYSKRFVVRSMTLVGATDGFIIRPFMKYFVIQGLLGAVLSLSLFSFFLYEVFKFIPDIKSLLDMKSVATIYVAVVVLGVLLTTLSTLFSMKKYLRADLDELYE